MLYEGWTRRWFVSAICLQLLTGCYSDDDGNPYAPEEPFFDPVYQTDPTWGRNGLIAYEDYGVVWFNGKGPVQSDHRLRGTWIIDPATGSKRRVGPWGLHPSLSPDGSRVALSTGEILTLHVDGAPMDTLTSFDAWAPAWSPDGQWIVYQSGLLLDYMSIWLMRSDGSEKQNLTPGEEATMPSWSPDGSQILHVRFKTSHFVGELYVMDRDGSNPRRIEIDMNPARPEFSPDGAWIAFSAHPARLPEKENIYIIRPDGSDMRQLTTEGGFSPSWSPDGKKIVYARDWWDRRGSPGYGVLWILDVETLEESQLTYPWRQMAIARHRGASPAP